MCETLTSQRLSVKGERGNGVVGMLGDCAHVEPLRRVRIDVA
jgi:hypothetical protein